MPGSAESVAVLGRALGWLVREGNAERARFVEATLLRWTDIDSDAPYAVAVGQVRGCLQGFDEADPGDRRARAHAAVRALVGLNVEPVRFDTPRVRAYPPELADVRRGAGDTTPPSVSESPGAQASVAAPVVAGPAAPTEPVVRAPGRDAEREERRGDRREGREGRREGREDRREDRRDDRPARADGERRPEERREDRPPRAEGERREGRDDRRGRRDRRDRRDEPRDGGTRENNAREAAPGDEVRVETPVEVLPPPPPPPPEPPPEPRTFPLGHPERTGLPVATLGVFDEAELNALQAAGVMTVADLLLRAPLSHERAGERWTPGTSRAGAVIVRGEVRSRCTRFSPGFRAYELVLGGDRGVIRCRWLGSIPPEIRGWVAGADVGVAGRLEITEDGPVVYEAEPLGVDGRGGDWMPRYEVPEVSDASIRSGIRAALRATAEQIADHLPSELIDRHKLLPLSEALRDGHFPSNAGRRGRFRLAFDEALQVQIGISLSQGRAVRERGLANPAVHALVSQGRALSGWEFNDNQELAFDDIRRDLKRTQPMARLLQGDVGSGKQAVIEASMAMVAQSGHQALFLAPDALAAEHRFLFGENFFRSIGLDPVLLNAPPSRVHAESLRKGDSRIIFGTHALLSAMPEMRRLGLVVVEDPGPQGPADLSTIEALNPRPDLLVVTPTPVPTAITLTAYGGLSLTVLQHQAHRGADVHIIDRERRDEAWQAGRDALARDQQVVVVIPLDGQRGADALALSQARRIAEVLAQDEFPGAKVGIFHGAMSREERFRAYDDFQHRRTQVLVATTHLEHGPVVPNVGVMIVEPAELCGLVRLHRLRGHVAQGWRRGQLYLVLGAEPTEKDQQMLGLLEKETDGLRIAELALAQTGLAAALGDRADDLPEFSWADPANDRELLLKTRQEAFRLLAADPGLKRRAHRGLQQLVRGRFGDEVLAEPSANPPPAADSGGRRRRRRRR